MIFSAKKSSAALKNFFWNKSLNLINFTIDEDEPLEEEENNGKIDKEAIEEQQLDEI